MPHIRTGDLTTYYELTGSGPTVVLIHGGFVDCRMWDPQVKALAAEYRVLRYDLRGHGRTGPSSLTRYSVERFADDLQALLSALEIQHATVCGLSFGGMIAQAYASKYSSALEGLVLADTAVSTTLTWVDALQRYLLAPRWLILATIRLLGGKRFVGFAFWMARRTRSSQWFGQDEAVQAYVEEAMLRMSTEEYVKIYGAIYDFDVVDLSVVRVPTLLLNGEHESRSVHRHAAYLQKHIASTEAMIIPGAGHTSNLENPAAFNDALGRFLGRVYSE
jgi:pimeloyl-ACP methyl ester carboxylesterase